MSYTLLSIKDIEDKSKLKKFDCGKKELNEFFSHYALKNDILGIGKTFVGIDYNKNVIGYFTLASAQVVFSDIPNEYSISLPKYPIPALRIARFAVSRALQGKGIGKWMMSIALKKVIQVSEITGLYLVIVDAKETSKSFYEHFGFTPLSGNELSYFLPVETIRKAIV